MQTKPVALNGKASEAADEDPRWQGGTCVWLWQVMACGLCLALGGLLVSAEPEPDKPVEADGGATKTGIEEYQAKLDAEAEPAIRAAVEANALREKYLRNKITIEELLDATGLRNLAEVEKDLKKKNLEREQAEQLRDAKRWDGGDDVNWVLPAVREWAEAFEDASIRLVVVGMRSCFSDADGAADETGRASFPKAETKFFDRDGVRVASISFQFPQVVIRLTGRNGFQEMEIHATANDLFWVDGVPKAVGGKETPSYAGYPVSVRKVKEWLDSRASGDLDAVLSELGKVEKLEKLEPEGGTGESHIFQGAGYTVTLVTKDGAIQSASIRYRGQNRESISSD